LRQAILSWIQLIADIQCYFWMDKHWAIIITSTLSQYQLSSGDPDLTLHRVMKAISSGFTRSVWMTSYFCDSPRWWSLKKSLSRWVSLAAFPVESTSVIKTLAVVPAPRRSPVHTKALNLPVPDISTELGNSSLWEKDVLLVLKLKPQSQCSCSLPTSTLGRVSLPTFFEPREGGGSQWLVERGFELREDGWNLNWTLPLWWKAKVERIIPSTHHPQYIWWLLEF